MRRATVYIRPSIESTFDADRKRNNRATKTEAEYLMMRGIEVVQKEFSFLSLRPETLASEKEPALRETVPEMLPEHAEAPAGGR